MLNDNLYYLLQFVIIMINNIRQLSLYIQADRIMAGLSPHKSFGERIIGLFGGGSRILKYQEYMRISDYLSNKKHNVVNHILFRYFYFRYNKLGERLGFSIGYRVFGYGLLIPHHGTIVINGDVRAGNYCVLHTSTCIGGGVKPLEMRYIWGLA